MTPGQNTLVVGVGYKARHGKNTVSETIVEAYRNQYNIHLYAFGDALKREVNEVDQLEVCLRNGIEYDFNPDMTDPKCQTKHGKQSKLLQWWGTEYRRKQNPFYWVKKLGDQLIADKPQIAIISDMRFKNEYYFVKASGGFVVKVNRQGFIDLTRDPHHRSEVELDGMDFDIEINVLDGEVEELKKDALIGFQMILDKMNPEVPTGMEGLVEVEIPRAA